MTLPPTEAATAAGDVVMQSEARPVSGTPKQLLALVMLPLDSGEEYTFTFAARKRGQRVEVRGFRADIAQHPTPSPLAADEDAVERALIAYFTPGAEWTGGWKEMSEAEGEVWTRESKERMRAAIQAAGDSGGREDRFVLAQRVWDALDRKSCPGVFLQIAYETIAGIAPAHPDSAAGQEEVRDLCDSLRGVANRGEVERGAQLLMHRAANALNALAAPVTAQQAPEGEGREEYRNLQVDVDVIERTDEAWSWIDDKWKPCVNRFRWGTKVTSDDPPIRRRIASPQPVGRGEG